MHGSYHIDGEIYNACVQSVLKYVTEAREMKDENLKVFRRQNVHMMVRYECEVSLKKRKRSVSTVAQMIGYNCSYVR